MTSRKVATALAMSVGASIGLTITYLNGGDPQWEGALLGAAFAGIGWGLVVMAHELLSDEVSEPRGQLTSPVRDTLAVEEEFSSQGSRRAFLVAMLGTALGALAVALGFPIRSLGRGPGRALHETSWHPGTKLVTDRGSPIAMGTLEPGSALTVFPETNPDAADSVVVLVRVNPDSLELPDGREDWAPGGYVAYSKICTHAGCPVGLFDAATGYLVCPCHQSSFDVLSGAVPRFGPAARPLPQLPLAFDEDGHLTANGEMSQPVGPGFSDLPGDDEA